MVTSKTRIRQPGFVFAEAKWREPCGGCGGENAVDGLRRSTGHGGSRIAAVFAGAR